MEKQEYTKPMTAQENVHRIITEWKKRRAEDEKEAAEKLNSPEFKNSIKQLKNKNAERGIVIPGL